MKWEGCFWIAVGWAEDRDYVVDIDGNNDCMCSESKIIELNANETDYEIKTYTLLHEAGHVLIYGSPGTMNLLPAKRRDEKTLTIEEKTRVVLEEVEAWKRGYRLGKRLCIPINDKTWEIEQADALYKYMKWALE
jgi:hypothetical protein